MTARGKSWIVLMTLATFLAAALAFSGYALAKVYHWKIQSAYPRGDASMELLKTFAQEVKKRSKGQLLIRIFADPELVPGANLFEATQKGTLDGLHALGAMWGGIVPVGEVEFGLPYAWRVPGGDKMTIKESGEKIYQFFHKSGFADLLRKEYAKKGLYWLDMHTYGPIFTLSTKPIKSCDDLKGKKARMEGSWSDYYNMLGARGTNLPGMEAYMALKMGVLDLSQWDVSAITGLKWHEVAPYWLRGTDPNHCIGHILLNKKSYDALPDNLKKVLHEGARDYWNALVKVHEEELAKVDKLVKAGKVKEVYFDKACQAQFEKTALELWDKIGKRDPAAAKAIGMIKKWRGLK